MWGVDNTLPVGSARRQGLHEVRAAGLGGDRHRSAALVPGRRGDPGRLRRRVRQLRHRLVRRPTTSQSPDVARRPDRSRSTRIFSSSRTRATSSPGSGLPAGDDRPLRRQTAGRTTGRRCGPTASRSSTTVDHGVLRRLQRRGRLHRRPPARRRQLRHQPAGRGDLRRAAAPPMRPPARSHRHASVRSSSPACCAARSTRPRPSKLVDFLVSSSLPERTAAEPVRLPGAYRRRRCRPSSPSSPSSPTDPLTIDPGEIAANRQQWQDEWTQHRAALNRPASVVHRRHRRLHQRRVHHRCCYAWPVVTLLVDRPLQHRADGRVAAPAAITAGDRVVHGCGRPRSAPS